MCRAFITGSRAYGRPRPGSDTDLVVLMDPETIEKLIPHADSHHRGSAETAVDASVNFGALNLICVADPRDYAWWRDGTAQLKDEFARHPDRLPGAIRERAIGVLEDMRAAAERERDLEDVRLRRLARGDMVGVSLLDLVRVGNTRPVWPAEFRTMVELLEKTPDDRDGYGKAADWLDEADEPQLAECFRYAFRKPAVKIYRSKDAVKSWSFENLPPAVSAHYTGWPGDRSTLAGLMATLWPALEAVRGDL